jgi:tetratricopeptide (TPR) repeat protein
MAEKNLIIFFIRKSIHKAREGKEETNYAVAYYNRGITYYDKKDYARAHADWEKALQLNPNDANARNNLEVLRGMGY